MATIAALAHLANLTKLRIESIKLDLARFDDYAHRLKPLARLKELKLGVDGFRGEFEWHSIVSKFVQLISTMFPNVARFKLNVFCPVSNVALVSR